LFEENLEILLIILANAKKKYALVENFCGISHKFCIFPTNKKITYFYRFALFSTQMKSRPHNGKLFGSFE
jgi:hypothetical protein